MSVKIPLASSRVAWISRMPEDFLATFDFPHHRDLVAALPGRFEQGGLDIHVAKWRLNAHAEAVNAFHHVHLCIENVALNAWNDKVAEQVLGPETLLHYFDTSRVMREDATSFNLWAWSANPSSIPKVVQLTVGDSQPMGAFAGPSGIIGRRALRQRVLVHLDRHEDFTPDANGNVPRRPHYSNRFDWSYRVVDGEPQPRERSVPSGRRRDDRDRREDDRDEDDRRGRRDDRQPSWRDRIFRSRSRAPHRRDEENRHDSRRDGRCDSRDGRDDGQRRRAVTPAPVAHGFDRRLPDRRSRSVERPAARGMHHSTSEDVLLRLCPAPPPVISLSSEPPPQARSGCAGRCPASELKSSPL